MNKYYLYILKCSDKTLYTGITTDLNRRLKEHNFSDFGARYTKSRRPVKLVFSKIFKNRSLASKEEARIKKLSRIKKLEILKLFSGGGRTSDVTSRPAKLQAITARRAINV